MPHKNDFRGSIESLDKCLHVKRRIIFLKLSIAENERLKNWGKNYFWCKKKKFPNFDVKSSCFGPL